MNVRPLRVILAASALSCSGSPIDPPSPVIVATPTTVCIGNDYATPITLDGTQSGASLLLIPSAADGGGGSLTYLWTLAGSAYKVVKGSTTAGKLTVTIAGDQPLQVDLRVTNESGGTMDGTTTVSVTTLSDGGCPLGHPG